MFDILDSDKDGMISSDFIDLSGLDSELKIVLAPILKELDLLEEGIDKTAFVAATSRLFKVRRGLLTCFSCLTQVHETRF